MKKTLGQALRERVKAGERIPSPYGSMVVPYLITTSRSWDGLTRSERRSWEDVAATLAAKDDAQTITMQGKGQIVAAVDPAPAQPSSMTVAFGMQCLKCQWTTSYWIGQPCPTHCGKCGHAYSFAAPNSPSACAPSAPPSPPVNALLKCDDHKGWLQWGNGTWIQGGDHHATCHDCNRLYIWRPSMMAPTSAPAPTQKSAELPAPAEAKAKKDEPRVCRTCGTEIFHSGLDRRCSSCAL